MTTAAVEIRAGMTPGNSMEEFHRVLPLNDFDGSRETFDSWIKENLFENSYLKDLINPNMLNWVEVTFIWF
jgi:hypothetical protein